MGDISGVGSEPRTEHGAIFEYSDCWLPGSAARCRPPLAGSAARWRSRKAANLNVDPLERGPFGSGLAWGDESGVWMALCLLLLLLLLLTKIDGGM